MTINNGDVLKIAYEATLPSNTIVQNVYHLEAHITAPQTDYLILTAVEAWLEDVYDDVAGSMKSTIVQNLCPVDIVAWDGTKWAVAENIGYVLPTIAYAEAGEALPQMDAAFVLFHTDRPKSNGKKFLAGYGEAQQAGGILTGPALTDLALFAAEVLGGINLAPLNDLVSGVPREAADVFLPFALAVATDLMMTQRRRRQGVGV